MERRGRLTYERLVNSLEGLHDAIEGQIPGTRARTQDLQRVIKNALDVARTGMSGASVPTPVQLKREVEARIAEVHERHDEIDEQEELSSNSIKHDASETLPHNSCALSPHSSTQENPAPRRSQCTPDSGKENATPPVEPYRSDTNQKPSAVRRRIIAQRPPPSKLTTNAAIKKRSPCTTRNKRAVQSPNTTSSPETEEADRRAAATALLGLAEFSPVSPFTAHSPASGTATSTSSKRARSLYDNDDDTSFSATNHDLSPSFASSYPVKKFLGSGSYEPLPQLDDTMNAQCAFAMGVEYAAQHLCVDRVSGDDSTADTLGAWVRTELALQVQSAVSQDPGLSRDCEALSASEARAVESGAMAVGKGFWDVV